jgi:hypothetical protein
VPVNLYRTAPVAVVAAVIGIFAINLRISSSILEAETQNDFLAAYVRRCCNFDLACLARDNLHSDSKYAKTKR